ncbi:MAG: hypothetical protein QM790_15105 [Nibricoccus sp.]
MGRTRSPFASKPALEGLETASREIRWAIMSMCQRAKTPLPGTALSCVDLLVALYCGALKTEPTLIDDPGRDQFIFDKPDAFCALYAILARRGFLSTDELQHFGESGSRLSRQPAPGRVPGIEWVPGSPGEALSVAAGIALAAHVRSSTANVYVLMDERDLCIRAARTMSGLAPRLGLGNLTAVIEANRPADTTQSTSADEWRLLGWNVREIDGHDLPAIAKALQTRRTDSVPLAIVAYTTKGKGIPLIEAGACETRAPTLEELETARKDLAL